MAIRMFTFIHLWDIGTLNMQKPKVIALNKSNATGSEYPAGRYILPQTYVLKITLIFQGQIQW